MSKQKPEKKLPTGPKGKTEDDGSDVQDKDIAKKLLETIDLAEQRSDKERAKIYGDLYPAISRMSKLKDKIMTVVLQTRWKYEKHHKKLSVINRGRKCPSKHMTNSLTKNQQLKLHKHRFDLFADLYKPSDLTSSEAFGLAVLEDNGLDREHHLGVVHDMTESSDLILPTTIFTSKFERYGNRTFMGFRYYKSMKDCLQAEAAHAIGYEL